MILSGTLAMQYPNIRNDMIKEHSTHIIAYSLLYASKRNQTYSKHIIAEIAKIEMAWNIRLGRALSTRPVQFARSSCAMNCTTMTTSAWQLHTPLSYGQLEATTMSHSKHMQGPTAQRNTRTPSGENEHGRTQRETQTAPRSKEKHSPGGT